MGNYRLKYKISIAAVIIGMILALNCGVAVMKTQMESSQMVLFLDPGHGGMDGGAVSSDGTPEKDINLAIALEVKELAEEYGWQVVMTREADESLGDGSGSIRSMKTADLMARREMLKKYQPKVAVSIHLNSFKEDISVKGAQVFYPDGWTDENLEQQCKEFAEIVQKNLSDSLDAEKERTALVKSDVFIFKEEVCPIVIVECGFLSNQEEAELLKSKEYQKTAAEGIMAGITEFTGFEKQTEVELIDSLGEKNKY